MRATLDTLCWAKGELKYWRGRELELSGKDRKSLTNLEIRCLETTRGRMLSLVEVIDYIEEINSSN